MKNVGINGFGLAITHRDKLNESLRPSARYYLGNSPVVTQAQEALDRVVRISGKTP
jgi:hypothetical protein